MKKIIFLLTWLFATNTALFAQIAPEQHDSTYWRKEGERVMREAPFVFKGKQINAKGFKACSNQSWVSIQWVVSEVFKGNLRIGDTIETHYGTDCTYNERGMVDCPLHGNRNIPITAGEWTEQYVFTDTINQPSIFKGCKSFKFYSHGVVFTGFLKRVFKNDIDLGILFTFYSHYSTEDAFLKHLYECLKPNTQQAPTGKTIPLPHRKSKNKGNVLVILNDKLCQYLH